jgi:hypothetical protein
MSHESVKLMVKYEDAALAVMRKLSETRVKVSQRPGRALVLLVRRIKAANSQA